MIYMTPYFPSVIIRVPKYTRVIQLLEEGFPRPKQSQKALDFLIDLEAKKKKKKNPMHISNKSLR